MMRFLFFLPIIICVHKIKLFSTESFEFQFKGRKIMFNLYFAVFYEGFFMFWGVLFQLFFIDKFKYFFGKLPVWS